MATKNDKDLENYNIDSRTPCKYGINCYQRNKDHLKKYKHLPKSLREAETDEATPPSKRQRVEEEESSSQQDSNVDQVPEPVEDNTTENSNGTDEESESETPINYKEFIKENFLVEMPQDFYDFWTFLTNIDSAKPQDALKKYDLSAVGPFDVLRGMAKKLSKKEKESILCHWRFYYDPPEYQSVIVGCADDYRIGYFRDSPEEDPAFVASMSSIKEGIINPLGDNIFTAVKSYLASKLSKIDLFRKAGLTKCIKNLENFAKEKGYSLESKTEKIKDRQKKIVSKSFHGAGIVVPVDKKTEVGYREIPETDADIKKMLKKIVEAPTKEEKNIKMADIQELMTNAQWATDEGDFGMALELGIDLFIYGGEDFHSFIKHLLNVSYSLLNRDTFSTILMAHLKNRRKGSNMSILDS